MNLLHQHCAEQLRSTSEALDLALKRADEAEASLAMAREQLDGAIEELSRAQIALELERTKRLSAEMLADSRRVECERLEEFARRAEESRNDAVTQLVDALQRANMQLIDSRTPREDPDARMKFEKAKENLRNAASNRHGNSVRKAMINGDLAIINAELLKRNPHAKPIPTEAEVTEPPKGSIN